MVLCYPVLSLLLLVLFSLALQEIKQLVIRESDSPLKPINITGPRYRYYVSSTFRRRCRDISSWGQCCDIFSWRAHHLRLRSESFSGFREHGRLQTPLFQELWNSTKGLRVLINCTCASLRDCIVPFVHNPVSASTSFYPPQNGGWIET